MPICKHTHTLSHYIEAIRKMHTNSTNSFYWISVSTGHSRTINASPSIDLLNLNSEFLRFARIRFLSHPFITHTHTHSPIVCEWVTVSEWIEHWNGSRGPTCCSCCILDIIWLVHIIDLDELYFVATTFRLLSKWLFNSVFENENQHFATPAIGMPSHILTLLTYWTSSPSGNVRNCRCNKCTLEHSIHPIRKWKFYTSNGFEMETLKPNELAIKCLFVCVCVRALRCIGAMTI